MVDAFRSLPPIDTSYRKSSHSSTGDAPGDSHSPGRRRSVHCRSPLIVPTKLNPFPSGEAPRCVLCLLSPSLYVCPCQTPAKTLCLSCFQLHVTFPAEEGHHQIPISFMDIVGNEEKIQTFLAYIRRLNSLKTGLLSNLEAVTVFQTQLCSEIDALVSDLQTAKQTYISQLEKVKIDIKTEIECAVLDIDDVLYFPHFQPLTGFEVQVLGCWSKDPDIRSTQLFTSEVNLREIRQQIAKLAYFHTQFDYFRSEESPPDVLAGISFNSLRLYNIQASKETRKNIRQSFTQGAVYCFIDHVTALCAGGVPPSTNVSKLALLTAVVSPGPPLIVPRGFSGIRKHGDFVYIFGGNWPSTSTCEKLSLGDWTWSELPRMSVPRYAFNPCYYKGELYLADAQNSPIIEAFSLAMDTFRTLPITLPEVSGNSVAFIANKTLHIATAYGQMATLNLSQKGDQFKVREVANPPIISSWPPIVVGNVVYFINYSSGQLRKYYMDTGLFL